MWSSNTETGSTVVIECQICNKRGHTAVNYFRRNTNTSSSGFVVECQICGKKRHSALECYHRGNYAYQGQPPPQSFNVMAAQQSTEFIPHDAWILDSGAPHHITVDVNSLNQVTHFEGSETITISNGIGLPIANNSSTTLKTKSSELLLKNVLHVPNIHGVYYLCNNYVMIIIAGSLVIKMYSLCKTKRQKRFCIKKRVVQDNCFKFMRSRIQSVCNLQYKVHQAILDSW